MYCTRFQERSSVSTKTMFGGRAAALAVTASGEGALPHPATKAAITPAENTLTRRELFMADNLVRWRCDRVRGMFGLGKPSFAESAARDVGTEYDRHGAARTSRSPAESSGGQACHPLP